MDKTPSTHTHSRDESFRGGRHGRGRGKGRSIRGRGRGNFDRKFSDENFSKWCNICKKNNHDERGCWNKGKPQCYNCKKFGHVQKDCKFRDEQQAGFTCIPNSP